VADLNKYTFHGHGHAKQLSEDKTIEYNDEFEEDCPERDTNSNLKDMDLDLAIKVDAHYDKKQDSRLQQDSNQ